MDVSVKDLQMVSLAGGAWLLQKFARAPANVPAPWFYAGLVTAGLGLYAWSTPDVLAQFKANWRFAIYGMVVWCLAVRGAAATSKDAKIAPASNTK